MRFGQATVILLAGLCLLATSARAQVVILSNIDETIPAASEENFGGWNFIQANGPLDTQFLAVSFTTPNDLLAITRVDLMLTEFEPGDLPRIAIETDNSLGQPGELFAPPLTGPDGGTGYISFTPATPIVLNPQTKYWLTVEIDPASPTRISWGWPRDFTQVTPTGVAALNEFRVSSANGTTYPTVLTFGANSVPQFAIIGTPIPEPATWTLLGVGLILIAFAARKRRP